MQISSFDYKRTTLRTEFDLEYMVNYATAVFDAALGVQRIRTTAESHRRILQWNREAGVYVDSVEANILRDQWGHIHARHLHPSFYDSEAMKPSRILPNAFDIWSLEYAEF